MSTLDRAVIRTPLGPVGAWWDQDGSLRVEWCNRTPATAAPRPLPKGLMRRLALAAAGNMVRFTDVPLPEGTEFQRRCWKVAQQIPRGKTLSYGEVARRAGRPGAARAVGQAMRRNPLPLIVPCHRVVAANGLGGYAGTDRPSDDRCQRKAALLEREQRGLKST